MGKRTGCAPPACRPRVSDPDSVAARSTELSRADVLLREALFVVEPLARLLVAHGVTYPTFAQALKRVFLNAAEAELSDSERKVTDSALSLLSGVHRKDVRSLGRTPEHDTATVQALSTASMVFARWIRSPDHRGADGRPLRLPLRAASASEPSFEKLSQSVTKDFHARSVLDELIRLKLASESDGWASLDAAAFVPTASFADAAYFFGQNVRDHLAASADNLTRLARQEPALLLEQAVFADGLSAASVNALHALAAQCWQATRQTMYSAAVERVAADEALQPGERPFRFRVGMFSYSVTVPAPDTGARAPAQHGAAATRVTSPSAETSS